MKLATATSFLTLFASTADAVLFFPQQAPLRNNTESHASLLADRCGRTGQDIDLPGSDLKSVKETSYQKCWDHCTGTSFCQAWSWNNYNGGTCWLKTGYGTASFSAGTMSGILYQSPGNNLCPPKFMILPNCDMPGNDVAGGSLPGRDFNVCVDAAGPKGYFFTWSDYNGGTCWLKHRSSTCQFASNKYTGIYLF